MSDRMKIRAVVQRLRRELGEQRDVNLDELIAYIDSMPEEHNGDLEEAAKEWAENHFQDFIEVEDDPGYWCSRFGFIAGAEWQKQKDFEDLLKSDMTQFKKCYEKGRFDMREEMMKALIGGEIVKDIHNQLSVKSEPLNYAFRDSKFGDKVKIIIVKED